MIGRRSFGTREVTERSAWIIDSGANHRVLERVLATLGFDRVESFPEGEVPSASPATHRVPSAVFYQLEEVVTGVFATIRDISYRLTPTPLFVLSQRSDVATAVRSIKAGAYDYFVVPLEEPRLLESLRAALPQVMDFNPEHWCSGCSARQQCSFADDRKTLYTFLSNRKAIDPREAAALAERNQPFLHASPAMQEIEEMAHRLADSDLTVLIRGESGVGKEVVARYIHRCSTRSESRFLKINCAAVPESLLESELFGYEKGAFTGATTRKPGKFDEADGGTLLLDEITEMPPSLQAKLLHVLQDKEFSRLGGSGTNRVDVRVLAATNQELERAVEDGRFREDLYFRVKVVDIYIPPLRERSEEIRLLVDYFLCAFSRHYERPPAVVDERLMNSFLRHPWPGNIRELENAIKRIVVLGKKMVGQEFTSDTPDIDAPFALNAPSLPLEQGSDSIPSVLKKTAGDATIVAERDLILKALQRTGWNRKKASSLLGVSYKTVRTKIKKYKLVEV